MLFMNGPFTNFFAGGLVMQLFRACFYPQVELLWGLMVWFIWNAQAEKEMFEKEDQKTAEQPVWSILTLKILSLTYSISFFLTLLCFLWPRYSFVAQWKWACKVWLCEKFQFMFVSALLCPLYYPQNFIWKLFPPFWLIPPLPLSSICLVVQISTLPCGQIENLFHGFDRILIMIWRMMKMRVVMMMLMMMRNTL